MKVCAKCKENLPNDQFRIDKRGNTCLQSYCHTCTRKTSAQWRKDNREKAVASAFTHFWKKLGIHLTKDMVAIQLEKQNYACAICKDDLTEVPYHYDHCHSSNELREILCGQCNRGLGYFADDPHILDLAAAYLRKHRALTAD